MPQLGATSSLTHNSSMSQKKKKKVKKSEHSLPLIQRGEMDEAITQGIQGSKMKQYKPPESNRRVSPKHARSPDDSRLEELMESAPQVQLMQTKVVRQVEESQVLYKDHLSYLLA